MPPITSSAGGPSPNVYARIGLPCWLWPSWTSFGSPIKSVSTQQPASAQPTLESMQVEMRRVARAYTFAMRDWPAMPSADKLAIPANRENHVLDVYLVDSRPVE